MKCKNCDFCDKSSRPYYCTKDNAVIDMDCYNRGKKMNCSETDREDREFMSDYIPWKISRGWH